VLGALSVSTEVEQAHDRWLGLLLQAAREVEADQRHLDGLRTAPPPEDTVELVDRMFDAASIGFALLDEQLRYVRVNKELAAINGVPVDLHRGRTLHEVLPTALAERVASWVRQVLHTGEAILGIEFSTEALTPGLARHYIVSLHPVARPAGLLDHVGVAVMDISDRKRLEEELRTRAEFLRSVIETSPDCIKVLDLDGRLLSMSSGGRKLLELDDVRPYLGRSWLDLWVAGDQEAARAALQVARSGGPVRFQGYAPTPGGRPKWWESVITPVAAAGDTRQLLVVTHDVTERVMIEKALRASEARFRTLASLAPIGLFLTDAQGSVVYVNEHWCEITGLSAPEALGQGWAQALPADELERVMAEWHAAARDGRAFECEHRVDRPDGQTRWVACRALTERDEHGRIVGFVGATADITHRKEASARHEALLRQAQDDARAKDEFLAVLAHELRNPLATMMSAVGILDHVGSADPSAARARRLIHRQTEHVARLLDDLLDVARIGQGQLDLQLDYQHLTDIVRQAVEAERHASEQKRQRLTITAPDGPFVVRCDAARLHQAFRNLVHNAIKYTPPGGAIDIAIGDAGDQWAVSVRDTGVGIPAEKLTAIFGLFTQLDRRPGVTAAGLGIGLSLVKRIVELHGGSVEARSEGRGHGSEFVVRLPRAYGAAAPPTEEASVAPAARGWRILLVEDDADARETLAFALRLAGHTVDEAGDAAEGLRRAGQARFDVIVVDIGLPGMSGYELAGKLRPSGAAGDGLLIALTGYGRPSDRRQTSEAGFDAHLVKPVEPHVLERAIGELMRRRDAAA
jgi:PAS domain S-box-containing protein